MEFEIFDFIAFVDFLKLVILDLEGLESRNFQRIVADLGHDLLQLHGTVGARKHDGELRVIEVSDSLVGFVTPSSMTAP